MNNVRIQILDYQYSSGIINNDKSVLGDLDVSAHSEFPLAITFATSDIRDIGVRKGAFSKTFKVPATKNNNRLLKSIYIPSSVTQATVTGKKACRITVDNLYSLEGLLQLTAIVVDNKPVSYSCIFFGDNIGWSELLKDKLIKDIDWGAEGEDLENVLTSYVDPTAGVLVNSHKGIKDTWAQDDATTVLSGYSTTIPYVYPIVSYGGYNPQGINSTLQLFSQSYLGGAFVGMYNGNPINNPTPVVDWRPCLWVYTMFKKIFAAVEYQISSDFIESDMFKRLLYSLPNYKYNNVDARYNSYSFESRVTGDYLVNDYTGQSIDNLVYVAAGGLYGLNHSLVTPSTSSDFYNPIGSAHFASDIFTVPEYGYYKVDLKNYYVQLENILIYQAGTTIKLPYNGAAASKINLGVILKIQKQTVSDPSGTWEDVASTSLVSEDVDPQQAATGGMVQISVDSSPFDFPSLSIPNTYYNKGDKFRIITTVRARIYSWIPSPLPHNYDIEYDLKIYASSSTGASSSYNIPFDGTYVEYGQTFNLTDVLDPEQKQMDFIKGISHAFNLQFNTDEKTKTIFIEPFNDYYKPLHESVDWTQKVDLSREQTDKWIETGIKRDVVFKYKEDSKDLKVKARGDVYWDGIPDEYPFQETLSNEFEKGDSVFENPFFSGTYNALDVDTYYFFLRPYNAVLWQENVSGNDWGRPVKGYEFQSRLLYWKKYSAGGLSGVGLKAEVQYFGNGTKLIVASAAAIIGGTILSNTYPQATSYNKYDIDSPILSYGNVWIRDYNEATGIFSPAVVGEGLYYTYYKQMFEMLKNSPRIKTLSVNLKITDIINLDMQQLVYIDGMYWRINKIIDFKPQANELTKVELIKWDTLGELSASVPQDDGGGGTSPPEGI